MTYMAAKPGTDIGGAFYSWLILLYEIYFPEIKTQHQNPTQST